MSRTGFFLALSFVLIFSGACSTFSPQVMIPAIPATQVYQQQYAVAPLAKPTYTPMPTATAEPTQSSEQVIEEPGSSTQAVAEAVIVDVQSANNIQAEAPVNYSGGKKILVDISEQHMYVYESELLVFSFVASTGMNNATRTGSFSVLDKIPNAYGATWNIWMPNWLGIYWAGSLQNGIHALPILPNGATLWAGFLGTPISYGCVVLDTYDSQLLFDWSEVGVPVEIQW